MLQIFTISLGCPKNRVDTEHLLGALPEFSAAKSMEEADCILINTCGFIRPAIEESVRSIIQAVTAQEEATKRPLLVVAGCLVGRYGAASMESDLPEVDLWLDNREIESWPQQFTQLLGVQQTAGRALSTGPSYAWLKISDGCNNACSFCTIPSIRGHMRSTPAPILVHEAQALLDKGVKELVIVAQDTTAWGRDSGEKHGLKSLLEHLLPLSGLERLRLMYLYPAGLTHDLLHFLQQAGKPFVPYFDVPLQHAHPDILARMGRPFSQDPRKIITRIREYFPEAALRTSLITGFPGESEEHFQALQNFVEESRFLHMGVFAYYAEEGTPAALMPDQLPATMKDWRRDVLMEQQSSISEELLEEYVGTSQAILVEEENPEWPGLHQGRTWFQAPEIDGVTYVSGEGVCSGAIVSADIVEAKEYDLVALV